MAALRLVDVYPLLTHLLGLPAQPHNGSLEAVRELLVSGAGRAGRALVTLGFLSAAAHQLSRTLQR